MPHGTTGKDDTTSGSNAVVAPKAPEHTQAVREAYVTLSGKAEGGQTERPKQARWKTEKDCFLLALRFFLFSLVVETCPTKKTKEMIISGGGIKLQCGYEVLSCHSPCIKQSCLCFASTFIVSLFSVFSDFISGFF